MSGKIRDETYAKNQTNHQTDKRKTQVISFEASLYNSDQWLNLTESYMKRTSRYKFLKNKGLDDAIEQRILTGWGAG